MAEVRLDPSWKKELEDQFDLPYWKTLTEKVRKDYQSTTVFPPAASIFKALDLCPFDKVKVVIVGQDPYHGERQANGLSFSVNDGVLLPPSLKNIYKEIESDLDIQTLTSGDLTRWASQGVLMLNSVLTVLAHKPASHANIGWEQFTDAMIHALNTDRQHVVYMLWGKYAQAKGAVIDRENNLVLESGHPSPYSANLFFGHHHFSQCNTYLKKHGMTEIDWR